MNGAGRFNYWDTFKLAGSIIICQLAGLAGSIFTRPAISTWYAGLVKPSFNPPNWVFAPVWITLYILMGISLYLVIRKGWNSPGVKKASMIFVVQLILNALWSFVFFGLHSPGAGMLVIVILWAAILLSLINFIRVRKIAGYLLLPYLLWVSFAAVLNLWIFLLN
jgi:tryptophan-rich sensory protein